MPIYIVDSTSDPDYIWYRSQYWDYIEQMKRGEVSGTLVRQVPPVTAEGIKIYSIKDISGLTEKQKAGLGIWHLVKVGNSGIKEFTGTKINPRRFETDLYDFSGLNIRPGMIVSFAPDGKRKWTGITLPQNTQGSLWNHIASIYVKMYGNNASQEERENYIKSMLLNERDVDRWLRQLKTWAQQRGTKASSISKYPREYMFKLTWRFKSPQIYFATLHTLGVLCRLILPGEMWGQPPMLWGRQGPVFSMEMSIGIPRRVEPGDFEALLKYGLIGEIRFFDHPFALAFEESRMFELFKIGVSLLGRVDRTMNRERQQLLGAFECPTANVIRFPLIREGTFLSNEGLREHIRNGGISRLRFRCHNMTAFQSAPFVPPIGGFPSHLSYVEVPIGKPKRPKIDYEAGED